jgi:predicted HAD superfamily phosphohydrolase YqeG
MPVIKSDRVVFFDVDDTLILWKKPEVDLPSININGKTFWIHTEHLRYIRKYHVLGFKIFVWSNSGYKWAEKVMKKLKIDKIVTAMCKPHRVFDDCKSLDDTMRHGWIKLRE